MSRKPIIPLLLGAGLGAVLFMARPAETAAPRAAGAMPVGYVDLKQVFQQSPAAQDAVKRAEELKKTLQEELALMQDTVALTEGEVKDLRELLDKKTPSDKDKARIAELRGKTQKLDEELVGLQQKPNPTAAETARIQELTQLFTTARNKLRTAMEARQTQLDQKGDELMSSLQDKILKAVEDVARDQGLSMVVDKQARLFGGVDITTHVVGRLKK